VTGRRGTLRAVDSVDCVVVGAGVVGLATGRALAIAGYETVVIERHDSFGTETSSRNSEVVHAGIHYLQGSLKARLCVGGRDLLYRYCSERGVPYRRCGKFIVATSEAQLPELAGIAESARGNGVSDLQFLERDVARSMEPGLECSGALWSPSTGIVDVHSYMLSLLGDAERLGAVIAYRTPVSSLRPVRGGTDVVTGNESQGHLRARWLINSAGLDAVALARRIEGFPSEHIPHEYRAKGSYFALTGSAPFSRLIYPVPELGGLGIHLTLDLAGQARFGPDVEWVDAIDYEVDPARAAGFCDAIRRYWPALADDALTPAYAGIRPKISGPGEPTADFRIDGPAVHGVPGIVNLFGIESPGLTAAGAIAEEVVATVRAGG
jgi:L-2-hydroxyglutarate oxidase LhgO